MAGDQRDFKRRLWVAKIVGVGNGDWRIPDPNFPDEADTLECACDPAAVFEGMRNRAEPRPQLLTHRTPLPSGKFVFRKCVYPPDPTSAFC